MRRVLVGVLVALLALTGCSQVIGTADWDRIEVSSTAVAGGDYTLVVTPDEFTYTVDGKATADKLPDGVWTTLTTGVRALGGREAVKCADGQAIQIRALAGTTLKQSYAANSCDAGDALKQAQALVEQFIATIS